MRTPKVTIVILNWNGWRDTVECLESVYRIDYSNYDIVVLDNGSKDDSLQKINDYAAGNIPVSSDFYDYDPGNKPISCAEYTREEIANSDKIREGLDRLHLEKELILIKNPENEGFAEGNNVAIRYALGALKPDYILMLNNDTVVDPSFLKELVLAAENGENIGVLGPTIYYYKPPRDIQAAGSKVLWNKGEAINLTYAKDQIPARPQEVDCLIGCAMLAKSELFKAIGYLNKNYFAYFEETEWCVRAREKSYKVVYVPGGKVWHKGGATSDRITGFSLYQYNRNRFWFMKAHASPLQYMVFLAYMFGIKLFSFTGWALLNDKEPLIPPFLKGVKDGLLRNG